MKGLSAMLAIPYYLAVTVRRASGVNIILLAVNVGCTNGVDTILLAVNVGRANRVDILVTMAKSGVSWLSINSDLSRFRG